MRKFAVFIGWIVLVLLVLGMGVSGTCTVLAFTKGPKAENLPLVAYAMIGGGVILLLGIAAYVLFNHLRRRR